MDRRITVLAMSVLVLGIGACGTVEPATRGPRTTRELVSTVRELPGSTDSAPSIDVSSTVPAAPTTVSSVIGPDFVIGGAQGVFQVVDGRPTQLVERPDVTWAADDGMGGVVFSAVPGTIEHLSAGATMPVTIATDATPNYVTMVGGAPTLEITRISRGECVDAESEDAALIDLATGALRLYAPCIPPESSGIHPRSIGGDLSVAVALGGSPDEEPVSARLVFRPSELPASITTLSGWDEEAMRLLGELELDLGANPWPEPCRWCTVDTRLSRDGTTLALAEFAPTPTDLGSIDWQAFDALDLRERWRRWEDLRRTAEIRIRTVDLEGGDLGYEAQIAGPGSLVDYDGRYLIYRFEGVGHHGRFPYNTHVIDTTTGEDLAVDWSAWDIGSGPASITLGMTRR